MDYVDNHHQTSPDSLEDPQEDLVIVEEPKEDVGVLDIMEDSQEEVSLEEHADVTSEESEAVDSHEDSSSPDIVEEIFH